MTRSLPSAFLSLLAVSTAAGQSFNIDVGPEASGPPSGYAAAGRPGLWLSLPAYHNTNTFNLTDVHGNSTPVRMWQFGGTQLATITDPQLVGDDAVLMNDTQITYTANLETCLFFYNMENGLYEIIIYARMPAQLGVVSYTSCDEESGTPHHVVGGSWTGEHKQFVSYAVHRAAVTSGLLRTHSGIVPGQNEAQGAAFNGIQIRKVEPGDVDGDGFVNVADLLGLLAAWGPCPGTDPPCDAGCYADFNLDCQVSVSDLLDLLADWG
jgi:hypothetical protein